jgi:hypothetical protein
VTPEDGFGLVQWTSFLTTTAFLVRPLPLAQIRLPFAECRWVLNGYNSLCNIFHDPIRVLASRHTLVYNCVRPRVHMLSGKGLRAGEPREDTA